MRVLLMLFCLCFAASAYAQATFNVSGSVNTDEQDYVVLDIDFGTMPGTRAVTLGISGNSTTEGLDVFIGDLDAMAATGFAGTVDSGSDAGTGNIALSVTSGSYTGVHQFALSIRSNTGNGPVTYTGTVGVTTLPTGAITQTETNTVAQNGYTEAFRLFSRAIQMNWGVDASGTPQPTEFMVDFGAAPQAITFVLTGDGSVAGDLEVFEVLANGTSNSLGTVSGATTDWTDDANFTSSSRSGVVRFRVVADTANMDFAWTAILPSTVTVQPYTQVHVAGSLAAGENHMHRLQIDFGATTSTVMLQFSDYTETGNFDAAFIDLDELAVNGSTTGFIGLNSEVTFFSGQGVTDILFSLEESNMSTATYDITMEFSVVPGGAALVASQSIGSPASFQSLFNRAVAGDESLTAAGTITREFTADFGGTTHTANLWFQFEGPTGTSAELFEINAAGTPVSLGILNPMGTSAETNLITSARTGVVTFRIEMVSTVAADMDVAVVFDSSVTVSVPGSGGGGGGDDSGCSTGTDQGGLLLLLAMLCMGFVALRRNAKHG